MDIRTTAVVGSGVMGQGIAQVFARSGYPVTIIDVRDDILANAVRSIKEGRYGLMNLVKKGTMTESEVDKIMGKIRTSTSYGSLSDADIVVEAVPENLDLKRKVFIDIEKNVSENAIIASNTSGITIAEIAQDLKKKDRAIGMHWFNPAGIMKLIEVVRAKMTSEDTISTVVDFSRRIGKTPVVVADVPGFFTTRFIEGWLLAAIRSYEANIATKADIDTMAKLAFGFPMGPFELMNIIGIDTVYHIAEYLREETGDPQFIPPVSLKQMVINGYLGDPKVKYGSKGGWFDMQ
ncbi:probable 3-hydroxyacyl-CoA dehydrogenase [Thermoplasma acidophilum]|uniref:Probable 3-hydroxyacyl-CoA dehydrogenase n=1 Tax=Thermoplasma acidophilum (strain ATCC 25905 / DSM 1728 / JCM 9062 / NBRC 15155 / AMRC-C165) TaxID=273075 RepID=Q9HKW7_THEAC|nr:3-hydroxyacyl-CoA dehydrogenase NAD-binding domain-containing protein [Thermoplasma acidophilum]MCY0852310.1 3-hydroxyacyl-CoA dehydrogenase NAD-binding domain-containing protein [Thermoplasma acidophilum]CAC11618.1 probable 3-hydroxyacyl-CoA dehydrogenase [Thermoplasma acidophilum]